MESIEAKEIKCERLIVNDKDGKAKVIIDTQLQTGPFVMLLGETHSIQLTFGDDTAIFSIIERRVENGKKTVEEPRLQISVQGSSGKINLTQEDGKVSVI